MTKIVLRSSFAGLNGKVALVTGANSGIGKVTAKDLALQGYQVILACRDATKAQAVIDDIAQASNGQALAHFIPLDLGCFDSVRACAQSFMAMQLPLDVLIANAGIAGGKGKSKSGFEVTFGVCHMGHFLLTQLLMPALEQADKARVVVVASKAHHLAKGIDFSKLKQRSSSFYALKEYGVAKLANILFASELAKRVADKGITTYSLHPGDVMTNVWRHVPKAIMLVIKQFLISEQEGAYTTIYCATSPEVASQSGQYYLNAKPKKPSKYAQDEQLARALWEYSEANC